jgi:predicted RNA-binding protein (TIGR00451 family)
MVGASGSEPRVKTRYPLPKKERKRLLDLMRGPLSKYVELIKKARVIEKARVSTSKGEVTIIMVDRTPILVQLNDDSFEPLLYTIVKRLAPKPDIPEVIVDRGAAVAVARGAKLMAPGVRAVEGDFQAGDLVIIVDEETGIPVALGRAIKDSNTIREMVSAKARGPVVKPTQRPGDTLWRVSEALARSG